MSTMYNNRAPSLITSDQVKEIVEAEDVITNTFRTVLGPELCKLHDDNVTVEIMVNPDGLVFAEKLGNEPTRVNNVLVSATNREYLCQLVARANNLSFTREKPLLQTVVPGTGNRFTASRSPISESVMFRIRKRIALRLTLEDYLEKGQLSKLQYNVLRRAVAENYRILIAGPQRTGKTTFASAVLTETAHQYPNACLGVIEDAPEILITAPNWYAHLTAPDLGLGFSKLVPIQLRFGASSLSLGELRGDGADALLDLWITGVKHTSITTIHAVSDSTALINFESKLAREGAPVNREHIMSAINLIVTLSRDRRGPHVSTITKIMTHNDRGFHLAPYTRT